MLVHPHPELHARALEAPGQFGRVEHGDPAPVVQPGQEGRGVDLFPYGRGVEELDAVGETPPLQLLVPRAQFFRLVRLGGDVDLAAALEVAVEGVAGDRGLDLVEVAGAQLLQLPDLVRPAGEPVGQTVGEGGGAEAAVAARGGPAHLAALHQDDIPPGVALLGDQRGPQSAVAAADDEQVAGLGAGERGLGAGSAGVVQPVRDRLGVGKGFRPLITTGHGAWGHDFNSLQG